MSSPFSHDPRRPDCNQCGRPMQNRGSRAESGKKRYRCYQCNVSTTRTAGEPAVSSGYCEETAAANCVRLKAAVRAGQKQFIITSACNNTPVHKGFFTALQSAAADKQAELIVIPISYKNISLYTGGQEYKKWWDSVLDEYLIDAEINLGGVVVDGDTKIQATAAEPLSGFHDVGGQVWRVIGHPQLSMMPVAMPGDIMPKRVYTTGAVTKKDYSRTKAGKKAEFHHTHAALIVELDGKRIFIRQLNYDESNGGGFYDLDVFYRKDGEITKGNPITVLATGDEHIKFFDKNVRQATYDAEDSIAQSLQPKYIVRQDIFDAYAITHHHDKQPLKQYEKFVRGNADAEKELRQVVEFIDATTPKESTNCIVPSNHHDHLDKWLDRADAKTDHVNAHLILELQKAQREAIDAGNEPDALRLYLQPRLKSKTVFLERNKPFAPNKRGADYSQHGDVGVNGSRGSARGLARSALKMTIGHSHGARIVKGVYQVGKSASRLEYERGLSDHTNTHCIEYQNGKRTLIDIIQGRWRLKNA